MRTPMKKTGFILVTVLLLWQCGDKRKITEPQPQTFIMEKTVTSAVDSLVARYGSGQAERIQKGVSQVASFWKETDGSEADFIRFCTDNFVHDTAGRQRLFERLSTNLETIYGYYTKISVDLQRPVQLDMGDIMPVDELFAAYSPFTHLTDDFFANKIAFIMILNFPRYSLEEKTALAGEWSRRDWAYARMGDVFDSRLPAEASQAVVNAATHTDMYISEYNIYAGRLLDNSGNSLFPEGMKLLSHWNIRDEIKASYGKEKALEKQRLLYEAMKRIITQQIPREVINSDRYTWNPYTNVVYEGKTVIAATPENDIRYANWLENFHAQLRVDPYYPELNTYIKRTFESDMEFAPEEVEKLFTELLASPEFPQVAAVVRSRLGRNLEPFDIWYDGFKSRSSVPGAVLDSIVKSRYPDRESVQRDLPQILIRLGFGMERAEEIASRIQVDPARGSGHATGSETRQEKSLLRTRIFKDGMDYKGYNIAIHEFGHNVEQTISLHHVDYYMLHGVPNTAFTEALAFIFQKRDLELLGFREKNPMQEAYGCLDDFWSLIEITGVSLVDIRTWKWLYDNPSATSSELREAVNRIATEVWNTYFAPVFGISDQPILAIYSHMVSYPLYLPNYAYGQIIQFQIEQHLKGKDFASEIERMYSLGRLIPQQWMQEAVGSEVSVQPIAESVRTALRQIN